jgi:hypothetical protein
MDFLNKIISIQRSFKENTLPLPEFFSNTTKKFLSEDEDENDLNVYLSSMISAIPEEELKSECIKSCKKAANDFYKDFYKEKLDKTIKFIEENNAHLEPNVRYEKYAELIRLMSFQDIEPEQNLNRMLAKKNLKIHSIRGTVPETFMYNDLLQLVQMYKIHYDLDEVANITANMKKKKRNERNRKKKEKKRVKKVKKALC